MGNDANISISRIGTSHILDSFHLLDVLVVPNLTKNLLSISKFTSNFQIDMLFTNTSFIIQNRHTKAVMARGRREQGLYVLEHARPALLANLKRNTLRAFFEL